MQKPITKHHYISQSFAFARAQRPLCGIVRVPGDKSISHRALLLGALAEGETLIAGLLQGDDVLATAMALRAMGVKINHGHDGLWRVQGVGLRGLREPTSILNMGNAGTGARLMMGIAASQNMTALFTGDSSLIQRPFARVIDPLTQMGATFLARTGGRLPLALRGAGEAITAIDYTLPVPSAQIKSAILLAGLNASGTTTVREEAPTRDHTENMLRHFGAHISSKDGVIHLTGRPTLQGCFFEVPADPSSAAFPALAALLVEGSQIRLREVCVNPLRDGFFRIVRDMGADVTYTAQRQVCGETVADIIVRGTGALTGIDVPPDIAPSMIDEFPALAILSACAKGTTRMTGLAELRVKESDRLAAMARGLATCGVHVEEGTDSLIIHGTGIPPKGGAMIETLLDHRIAMSFLMLGLVTVNPVEVDDTVPISTSFPHFIETIAALNEG